MARTITASEAIGFLSARGFCPQPSNRRGFDWSVCLPGCTQHLTTAELVEFATNEARQG